MTAQLVIEDEVSNAAKLVKDRYKTFSSNPDDPESNHKFRVSIRTLRSLASFIREWEKGKQNARMRKDLKLVVQDTSRLRELDVLCELVKESGQASAELVAACENEAASERARVLESLHSREQRTRLKRALKQARNLQWKSSVKKHGLTAEEVRARFLEQASILQEDLAQLDESDYEEVHETRKRVKQVRYVAEKFSELLDDDAQDIAAQMKAAQDRLGALCDARVNRTIVESFLDSGTLSPALAEELASIVAQ